MVDVRRALVRLGELPDRAANHVPGVRRVLEELGRVEVVDRTMIIAAQALLALIPLLIVLGAFLPHEVAVAGLERFEAATGIRPEQTADVRRVLDADQVRTQTGIAGLALTLFSATSFARAVQRMYERVWDVPRLGGMTASRRCLLWLAGWLLCLQLLPLAGSVVRGIGTPTVVVAMVQMVVSALIWWWTSWLLLLGRVSWSYLAAGAVLTGVGTVAYAGLSSLFMPWYAENNVEQLGVLGLVLAVATWLIGFAFVLVVAAVVGRVGTEDERIRAAYRGVRDWVLGLWPRADS